MRKSSEQSIKQSPVLVLMEGEGKWADYQFKYKYIEKLEKFTGLLYLQDNNQYKILLQIVDIKFENLMKLSLQNNNIESIQSICCLYCPKLVELQLGDNRINSIKSLRKSHFENLKVLSLRKNKIIQFQPFQELYSIVRNLFIQWYDDIGYCQDVSQLLKMETFQLKSLLIESKSRIIQQNVFKQLQNRFSNAKLSYNRMKNI